MGAERVAPIVLFAILLALTLYFILRPLGAGSSREAAQREGRRLRLLERKGVLLQLLRDLEFDRKTGKLSEADFAAAREETEAHALDVFAELDALEQPWSEERIEEEIAAARARLEAGGRRRPEAS